MNETAEAQERLSAEWNRLRSTWRDSRVTWDDSVAAEFEKRFIESLESDIPSFLRSLESLADELRAARRELRQD